MCMQQPQIRFFEMIILFSTPSLWRSHFFIWCHHLQQMSTFPTFKLISALLPLHFQQKLHCVEERSVVWGILFYRGLFSGLHKVTRLWPQGKLWIWCKPQSNHCNARAFNAHVNNYFVHRNAFFQVFID